MNQRKRQVAEKGPGSPPDAFLSLFLPRLSENWQHQPLRSLFQQPGQVERNSELRQCGIDELFDRAQWMPLCTTVAGDIKQIIELCFDSIPLIVQR
jgi:hypothetical protein